MNKILKTCPFCGGKAEIDRICSVNEPECLQYLLHFHCNKCGVSMLANSEEIAVPSWNTRTQPENNPLTLDEIKSLKDGDVVWLSTDGFLEPIIIINILSTVINFGYFINSKGGSQIDLTDINKYYFLYRNKPDHIADVSKKDEV